MSDCSVALRAVTPMNSAAATRMRAAGSVLSGLPRDEHNTLVGALAFGTRARVGAAAAVSAQHMDLDPLVHR